MQGYEIRLATEDDDMYQLVELVMESIDNSPYKDYTTRRTDFCDLAKLYINLPKDKGAVFIMINDGCIVGYLVAVISECHPLFIYDKLSAELVWYVKPEHRGKHSLKLLKEYMKWAKEIDCKIVNVACFENEFAPTLDRVYKSLGFTKMENHYCMRNY